jgi:hypothetical protein
MHHEILLVLYNFLTEYSVLMNVVYLMKMFLNDTHHKISLGNTWYICYSQCSDIRGCCIASVISRNTEPKCIFMYHLLNAGRIKVVRNSCKKLKFAFLTISRSIKERQNPKLCT